VVWSSKLAKETRPTQRKSLFFKGDYANVGGHIMRVFVNRNKKFFREKRQKNDMSLSNFP
jgi:hypothetical protein